MSQPQETPPTGLEFKDTTGATSAERGGRDATFPLRSAPIPHLDRTGAALNDDERKSSYAAVGSPAYGDGVANDNVATLGAANGSESPIVEKDGMTSGLSTSSGGTQTESALGKSESTGTTARSRKSSS